MLHRPLMLAVVVVAAALAPAASAATPFTAGSGTKPDVAVGADGTGHVVWNTSTNPIDVAYCRVPAGASACDKTATLDLPAGAASIGRPVVSTPAAGKVIVVGGCHSCGAGNNRVYMWSSTTNGDSFGAPTLIGNGNTEIQGRGLWLDDLNRFVEASGSTTKATDTTIPLDDGVQFSTSGLFVYGTQVVRVPGTNKLVVAADDLDSIKFGVYTGDSTLLQMNDETKWIKDGALPAPEGDNSETGLNAGPAGVFVAYENQIPGAGHVGLRRFDPVANAFGAPTYIEGSDAIDHNGLGYVASTQDATGRVHALWRSLYDDGRLRYVVSDASGANFSVPATIAAKEGFYEPSIGAGPAGTGFAVWTLGASGDVRVVPLDPQAETSGGGTPGGGTPGGGTPGGGTPGAGTPGPTYTGPLTGRPVTVPGGTITFLTPSSCVRPGQTFKVRMKFKKRKRKGNVVIKIFRTDFYKGKKIVKKDRRAPFVHTFKVKTSQIPGSTITLRARAWMKVRHGKPPKKSIRSTIRVCA